MYLPHLLTVSFYQQHPVAVKAAIGKTLEHLGDEAAQAA
jgi:hypothetical protein